MLLPVEKRFTQHHRLPVGILGIPRRDAAIDDPRNLRACHAPVPSRSAIDVRGLHSKVARFLTYLHRRVQRLLAKQVAHTERDTRTEVRPECAAAGGEIGLPERNEREAWTVAAALKCWLTWCGDCQRKRR